MSSQNFIRIGTRQDGIQLTRQFGLRGSFRKHVGGQIALSLGVIVVVAVVRLIGPPQRLRRGKVTRQIHGNRSTDAGNLLQLSNPAIGGAIIIGIHVTAFGFEFLYALQFRYNEILVRLLRQDPGHFA